MFLITVPRLSTVDEPFSFRSFMSVTLSPSASSAPFESLALMSMVVNVLCEKMYGAPPSLLPLWEKVARTKSAPDEGLWSIDRKRPLTRLASGDASHPLPQGERGRRIASRF